jgi:TolB-like protein/Tfp pilus assembly protein PilF
VNPKNFFAELKRRNVYKVAIAYGVVAWLLMQIASQIFPFFEIPNWAVRLVVLLLVIGFPVALILAWAFELTPEGIKRTEDVDAVGQRPRGGAWVYIVLIGAALSVGLFFFGRYTASRAALPGAGRPGGPSIPEKSVAVLPFVNMSSDKENDYFVDGLTEEILNRVAQINELKVPGRTSSFVFKDKNADLRQVGASLGVAHVLEGSARKAGDRLRIITQLVRTSDGYHLWSQSYDRKLDDVFAIQEEIAHAIADALSLELKLRSERTQQPTRDVVAYNNYLEALSLITRRNPENLRRAITLLQSATQRDAGFAKAWGALAQAHALAPNYGIARFTDSDERAEAAARKALAIDNSVAAAHSALADVLSNRFDWTNSEREYRRALELSPNEAETHDQYAQMLMRVAHMSAALEHANRACEIDPLAWVPPSIVAIIHLSRGELDQSRKFLNRSEALARARTPLHVAAEFFYALSTHDAPLAQQILAAMRLKPKFAADQKLVEAAEQALRADPDPAPDLRSALNEAQSMGEISLCLPFAGAAVAVNQRDAALDAWDAGFRSQYFFDIAFIWFPVFRPLYNELRFKELLNKTKLPEYWREAGWGDFCHAKNADDFDCVAQ